MRGAVVHGLSALWPSEAAQCIQVQQAGVRFDWKSYNALNEILASTTKTFYLF